VSLLQLVTVNPTAVTLPPSGIQQFTSTAWVTWSVSPAVGTITATGLNLGRYTAPAVITDMQTVIVTATSVADPTKSAHATVTLAPPVTISVTPPTATLTVSQSQALTATVTGTTNTGVVWSLGSPQELGKTFKYR
jgi:hypothetical protein